MGKNQIKSDFSTLLKNYHAHRRQVATKELAIKAIDGASGAKSLEALHEVAMEQAK